MLTYKRVHGALGISSWVKMDLYLGQKQRNYVISMTGPVRPANADWGGILKKNNITIPWHLIYFQGFLLAYIIHINVVVNYIWSGVNSIGQTTAACTRSWFRAFLTRKCCLGGVPYKNTIIFFVQGSNSFNHYMEMGIYLTQTNIKLK